MWLEDSNFLHILTYDSGTMFMSVEGIDNIDFIYEWTKRGVGF